MSPRRFYCLLLTLLCLVAADASGKSKRGKTKKKTTATKKVEAPASLPTLPAKAQPVKPPLPAAGAGEISLVAVGDIMMGSTYPDDSGGSLPPDDGASLLAEVTPTLAAADVAFGNLEGPLIDGGSSSKCPKK